MTEMHINASRVDAVLHAQRFAGGDALFQFLAQFAKRFDLVGAAADQFELFVDGLHARSS
jgi:hypothetical protein